MLDTFPKQSCDDGASNNQKNRLDCFASRLNEPLQEWLLNFSRPDKRGLVIRIVADAVQRRCVAEVRVDGQTFVNRLKSVKGEISWDQWTLFCRRLLQNYQAWTWDGVYGTNVVLEVARWSLSFRSASPKDGLIRWHALINIKGFDVWPGAWNLMRQSLVRILLPLYSEGAERALAKDALMKFLAAKAEIKGTS